MASKNRNLSAMPTNTNSMKVPVGNTATRGANTAGFIRFNSDLNTLEAANGVMWANVGSGSASSSSSASNLTSLTGNVFISSAGGLIDASNSSLGLVLPTGTFAQRPVNAANGTIRWNTSNTVAEIYVGGTIWKTIATGSYTVDYLIVAGGGGGGPRGGGGGAGGLLTGSNFSITPGTNYSVVVGAGGVVVVGVNASD